MKGNNSDLLKYAGLATQLLVGIGIGVFAGIKLDSLFRFKIPLLVWLLPLLIIVSVIIKIVKDTSKNR